jgi:hypothetical protein
VNGKEVPAIFYDHRAFTLKGLLGVLDVDDKGTIIVQNVRDYSPNDTASHPRKDTNHQPSVSNKTFHMQHVPRSLKIHKLLLERHLLQKYGAKVATN